MPVRRPPTPDPIVRYGWRDHPYPFDGKYRGRGVCNSCSGWGTKFVNVGEDAVICHVTCRSCGGTGHA